MNNPKKLFLEEWLTIAILVVIATLVCAGVLSRYVFRWSFSFTEELTRYLMIWLTCVGFSAGFARGEIIQFQWPGNHSARRNIFFRRFGVLVGILFSLILLGSAIQNILLQWKYNQPTSVMGWPIVWVSAALPVAAALYLIRSIRGYRSLDNSERR